ncbi:Arc family DNA-binding protein [uncultured Pseudacidovorax sp.]|uniref:Arc family DNA-binding protein n=1 Tax=uncultured Pseudacidovorax sp. TaxID=679313 RepID=UPI0025F52D35|nr:Arc family DNA-binding protein [uncultured Pseudacidovorax sp.]
MKAASQLAPSPIRLPQELKDWLKHRAIDNRRSFNSEVLARLEQSRRVEEQGEKEEA